MGHTAGMHSRDRAAAIRFGELMPASRIVINSPTTHGAIGLSTGLPPSMTLGCGSWGGNVTSDNVSPVHLIDIKRVAFETKPVNRTAVPPAPAVIAKPSKAAAVSRDAIATLVDSFLREKLASAPAPAAPPPAPEPKPVPPVPAPVAESPVRTIIHELRPTQAESRPRVAVDFVSEADVRTAVDKGEKIFVNSKTLITPAARDLGEEKDVFARV
jgi:acetaldehyde dehydrogenase (acetylating)